MKAKLTYRGVIMRTGTSAAHTTGSKVAPSIVKVAPSAGAANPRVRVAREVAGRGGKSVSVITGLPLSAGELETLAARLKKLCGAGGAVRDGTIEIQGEHRDRLVAELQKLGYEAKRGGG